MLYDSNWNIFVAKNYHELKILTEHITKLKATYLEDTFHDILLYLHKSKALSKYEPSRGQFNTWISYRIKFAFTNLLSTKYKYLGSEVFIDHVEDLSNIDLAFDTDPLLLKNIQKCLTKKQSVLLNYILNGYTYTEIADKLNISRQSVNHMLKLVISKCNYLKRNIK